MEKVTGRTDDMIVVRGVNVFPSQIESVLLQIGEIEPHYQIIVDRGPIRLTIWKYGWKSRKGLAKNRAN